MRKFTVIASTRYLLLSVLSAFVLAGCGGGGSGGSPGTPSPNPPDPNAGNTKVSVSISIPPTNKVEREPNDAIPTANGIQEGDTVSGDVSTSDPGTIVRNLNGDLVKIHDFYRLTTTGPAHIELRVGAGDLNVHDVDLYLMDQSGAVLKQSIDVFELEAVEVPAAGTYLIGVSAFSGSSPYLMAAAIASTRTTTFSGVTAGAPFVPGELLVKMKPGKHLVDPSGAGIASAAAALPAGSVELQRLSSDVMRYRVGNNEGARSALSPGAASKGKARSATAGEASLGATLSALLRLRRNPNVEFAEPNYIVKPMRVPNDPDYSSQWHYRAISLPEAWDITIGTENAVTVGVIDTGIDNTHLDFAGKLVPGYDFISDPNVALDGDGRDNNPNDEGDDPRNINSSFHGIHVAGTIAAASNNGIGVSGVSWGAKIMPLRALGAGGGSMFDVAEAVLYAAGLSNISPGPSRKVDILNMSLGCNCQSTALSDALGRARARGVILVAAAGNEATSTPSTPASVDGVISVSAVGPSLSLAPYSNFGSTIDIAAPGGDMSARLADGVLSTSKRDNGAPIYRFLQGTSMAAPHVSGVIALMKAVNPALTPDDIDRLIAGTHSGTSIRITSDRGAVGRDNLYGHGVIDAARAVRAAQALTGAPPAPAAPVMSLSSSAITLEPFVEIAHVQVTNSGSGVLNISSVTSNQPWLAVSPVSGTAPMQIRITANRTTLGLGVHPAQITVRGNGTPSVATVNVDVKVAATTSSGDVGKIFVLVIDPDTSQTVLEGETDRADGYHIAPGSLPKGRYYVLAGTDRDNDDFICDIEDACGAWPEEVIIGEGGQLDLNFVAANWVELQDIAPSPNGAQSAVARALEGKIRRAGGIRIRSIRK